MADDPSTSDEAAETVVVEQQPETKPADVPNEVKAALRKANKEAETLRLRLKEFEDRDKTETQKLAERAEMAERERDAIRSEAMRARVALAKGLKPDLIDRLRGDTEDELSEDADRLLELLKPDGPPRFGDVDQGVRTTSPSAKGDERQTARALFGGNT